jgi:hypothetical protein
MALAGIGVIAAALVAQRLLQHFWTFGFWAKAGAVAGVVACIYVFSTLFGGKGDDAAPPKSQP